ncbi:hypothetical protein M427DRAFT_455228 [Gonapodya prolifera JEL478]|uniref:Uncharacterized protein n=1 Tax=Gonapodya prolifera (strain JEL478) TaxID=1344416 RepID=A0A139A3D7_GONPJ|nr:hypothetical protein M427DRAFT_455228 [Gonapodya prolifera JEL478]|eukprot:KXS10995.1 hypothetical protein M427DRAFT_455228 [Gonapodya prolifera JEL478]
MQLSRITHSPNRYKMAQNHKTDQVPKCHQFSVKKIVFLLLLIAKMSVLQIVICTLLAKRQKHLLDHFSPTTLQGGTIPIKIIPSTTLHMLQFTVSTPRTILLFPNLSLTTAACCAGQM